MSTIVAEKSPYLHRKANVYRMMLDVIIALLPTVVFSVIAFSWNALIIIGISIATMMAAEFVFVGLRNKMPYDGNKHSFKEKFKYAYSKFTLVNILTPVVSALIFAMIIPASAPWYVTLIGALAGITLGKLLFGGLGTNIFNPAAVGMVVVKISFGSQLQPVGGTFFDLQAGGTVLTSINGSGFASISNYSVLDLFLGRCPGTLGEISAICILVGAIYLFIRRSADIRITGSYLITFALLMAIAGIFVSQQAHVNYWQFMGVEMLSGGLLFGAVFMLTDPVTSPINSPSRIMFGVIAGVCTAFIRLFAALPEGVVFSILIANMFAPVLDYYKWSGSQYTWKKILAIALIFAIPCIIMTLVLAFGGVIK